MLKKNYMCIIDSLNQEIKNGFSKSDLERLIGLTKNSLSSIMSGKKKLSRKSEIKIERFLKSEKPDPLNINFKKGIITTYDSKSVPNEPILDSKKRDEIEHKNSQEKEYDFGNDKFLVMEKYTKHPLKDIPKNTVEKFNWLKEKEEADNKIKLAWNNRNNK